VAEEYQEKGFENAKALLGGVAAWKQAGYEVLGPQARPKIDELDAR
jgi:rhodanese-related sulfurtransferase